jgi:hypothetical protein
MHVLFLCFSARISHEYLFPLKYMCHAATLCNAIFSKDLTARELVLAPYKTSSRHLLLFRLPVLLPCTFSPAPICYRTAVL